MHEITVAENLKEIILEAAKKENLERITRVDICFGQMVQIVPEIFEFAFRESVRNTPAMEAELGIEIIPVRLKCNICGEECTINDNFFMCHKCGSTDIEIKEGKELFVKSIEGD